jgi:hypothetical protein
MASWRSRSARTALVLVLIGMACAPVGVSTESLAASHDGSREGESSSHDGSSERAGHSRDGSREGESSSHDGSSERPGHSHDGSREGESSSHDGSSERDRPSHGGSGQGESSSHRNPPLGETSTRGAPSQGQSSGQGERSRREHSSQGGDSHASRTTGGSGSGEGAFSGPSRARELSSRSSLTQGGAITPRPSAPASAAPGAPAGLAPAVKIGTVTGQPAGARKPRRSASRRSARARQRAARRGANPFAGVAATTGGTLLAAQQSSTSTTHAVAKRVRAPARAPSNPLARLGGQIPLPVPVPDWSKPIIVVLLLLATWFGIRSRLAALRARRLERQHAGLLRDLGVMQAALVPELPAMLGGLAVSVAYRPAEGPAAGGDFYDLFALEPGKVAVILGDVAGHGHEALTHAALTRYTLRAYLQAGLEPRMALALAGQVLVDPTGERFATVAVGTYETQTSKLTYALAGHPPPILLGFPTREPLTICSSPPIGWGMPTGRRQTTVSLPAGAQACFFSDGLVEARCGGQLLGRERLSEILAGLGPRPEADELLEKVRAAAQGAPDDMVACVLAAEPTASDQHLRVEELEADGRALTGPGVRRFLEECLVPAPEITRIIELASGIAASSGAAVLRVELGPTSATATAFAPSSASPRRRAAGTAPAADQPLLAALAAG